MFDIQIDQSNIDQLQAAFERYPTLVERARASALKSLAYHIREDVQRAGRALQPKLNPHTGVLSVTHDTAKRKGTSVKWRKKRKKGTNEWSTGTARSAGKGGRVAQKVSNRLNPFSRFVNMIRYDVDVEDAMVTIGILNPRPIYYVWFRKNVEGFDTVILPRMRKFLFAAGFPVAKGTTFTTPPRPWIGPVREKWDGAKATDLFREKYDSAMERYFAGFLGPS